MTALLVALAIIIALPVILLSLVCWALASRDIAVDIWGAW